jgi:hypothetical protein
MSTLRFHAIKETLNRKPLKKIEEKERRSAILEPMYLMKLP